MKGKAQECSRRHGISDPIQLVIACRCRGCDGELHCDGVVATGVTGLLTCTMCGCAYAIPATKEIRR